MEQVSELVATFLAHTRSRFAPPTAAEAAALDALLVRAWEQARTQWPAVTLPVTPFAVHVAERLPINPVGPIGPLVAGLSLAELYLTCACLQGLAPAHEAFERNYLARLPGKLRRLKQPDSMIDDVCQIARVKLLVATPESAPKIGDYTGRGALLSWVLVIAGRIASRLRAAEKPATDDSSEEFINKAIPGQGIDPALDVMKRRHQAEFREALREAAATLSADERHLLRLHFSEQLSTYELGSLFRVNQSTISRWLKSARQRVYEETRSRLQERLGLSTPGLKSFLAFVGSQLDMNISQILAEKDV